MNKIKSVLWRVTPLAVLWWILTGGAAEGWLFGIVTVALAYLASRSLQRPSDVRISLPGLAAFAAFFLNRSVRAGVQVAGAALRPRLALAPAVLHIPLRLQGEMERFLLSATLNLLPGTLVAGGNASHFQVHVLDSRRPMETEVRAVEARVARIFNTALS